MPFALSGGPGDAAAQLIAHLQCVGMLEVADEKPDCRENFSTMCAQRTNGCKEASEKGMHPAAWREACESAVRMQTRRVYCCQCLLFMPRIHNCLVQRALQRPCMSLCERVGCRETSIADECATLSDSLPSPPVTPPICS